jgi:hypothetical protein
VAEKQEAKKPENRIKVEKICIVMEEDRIWKLIARKLAGEASKGELKELQDLLGTNPELHFTIESFYKFWKAVPVKQAKEGYADKLWGRIRDQNKLHY